MATFETLAEQFNRLDGVKVFEVDSKNSTIEFGCCERSSLDVIVENGFEINDTVAIAMGNVTALSSPLYLFTLIAPKMRHKAINAMSELLEDALQNGHQKVYLKDELNKIGDFSDETIADVEELLERNRDFVSTVEKPFPEGSLLDPLAAVVCGRMLATIVNSDFVFHDGMLLLLKKGIDIGLEIAERYSYEPDSDKDFIEIFIGQPESVKEYIALADDLEALSRDEFDGDEDEVNCRIEKMLGFPEGASKTVIARGCELDLDN